MTLFHAIVWIDRQSAQILQFDAEHVQAQRVKAHTHHTAQHGSSVRTEHAFFGQVCDVLDGIPEVLVAGGKKAQADFGRYVEKHRPALAKLIVGWETVARPAENQFVGLARQYFMKYDRKAGTRTPG